MSIPCFFGSLQVPAEQSSLELVSLGTSHRERHSEHWLVAHFVLQQISHQTYPKGANRRGSSISVPAEQPPTWIVGVAGDERDQNAVKFQARMRHRALLWNLVLTSGRGWALLQGSQAISPCKWLDQCQERYNEADDLQILYHEVRLTLAPISLLAAQSSPSTTK